ncbi:DUF2807 domain-containing protein [Polaribacter sp.]|nr:DUF2807 domain-containing protein [Polaribacter sp.]
MKKIIFIGVFFFAFSIHAQSKVTKNLGDYTILKVYNGIEVELIKSTENKIEITGEKSEIVKVKTVNNTLKLSLPFSLNPSKNAANGEILIQLFYKDILTVIDANQGATITAKDFQQDEVEISAQERAYINLVLKSKNIIVKAISGGIVKLTGTADNQDVDVDLYGVYHGYGLKVTNSAMVKAKTGAKAEIFAGKVLNAKVRFGGSIFYKGTPDLIRDEKLIGGIIQKKD